MVFPGTSAGKESTCNSGDPGSIPKLGKSAGEGTGYVLQYSWAFLVAQLVKYLPAMQETWVQSVGRFPWRKQQLPTPVFWPGDFCGLYGPWGYNESDMTEQNFHFHCTASLMAKMVKNMPAMWETWFQSLGWEDPLKGVVTHFSIMACRIPWTV